MPTELNPAPTKKPATSGDSPEDELVVGREALGPVVELADAGALEHGQAVHGALHEHREVLPVLVEQLELEGVRDLLGRDPGLRLRLEPADDEAADLLLDVGPAVGVAQDRQVAVHPLDLVGDDVEVLGRVQRHPDPGQRADRLGPLAGAVDDDLALDVTVVGAHPADPPPTGRGRVGHDVEPGDPHPFPHRHPELAGALRQRLGDVGGVRRAVAGQPDRAGEVVGAQQRVPLPRLLGGEQLALEVVGGGGRGRAPQRRHPVVGAGDDEPAALPVAGAQAGLGLEPLVELGGVLHEAGAALAGPQQPDQPGGVPGGAARQGALLEQQHVGLAEVGQVVGRRRTDDAPADDDDPGPGGQRGLSAGALIGPPPGRAASSNRGCRRAAAAGSSLAIDHSQKSNSSGLVPSWIIPHSVQP